MRRTVLLSVAIVLVVATMLVWAALGTTLSAVNGAAGEAQAQPCDTTTIGPDVPPVAQPPEADVVAAFKHAIHAIRANQMEQLALWEAGIIESGLRNLHYGDADSQGALQERVSIYGLAHALDPEASGTRFLRDAQKLRPWHQSAGLLAAAVQRPKAEFAGRYDTVEAQARKYLSGSDAPDVTTPEQCAPNGAAGPANLQTAVQLASPRRYADLPGWAMAFGRAPEQVDARILPDVLWVLRTYGLRVNAARESGHHTHGDGTALDMRPAAGDDQQAWDNSALRLAHDLGWTEQCAAAGVSPVCPLVPAIHGVFYNSYPGHGDPAHAGGNAHIHVSWFASSWGNSGLVAPNAWVMAFPAG
jgi:hypothetical protein